MVEINKFLGVGWSSLTSHSVKDNTVCAVSRHGFKHTHFVCVCLTDALEVGQVGCGCVFVGTR